MVNSLKRQPYGYKLVFGKIDIICKKYEEYLFNICTVFNKYSNLYAQRLHDFLQIFTKDFKKICLIFADCLQKSFVIFS